jgi:DNA (cytosine-5)-methyltransferase 1
MIAIDFFCGAGGLTKGFLNAGISVILGIEIDEGCRETYEKNNHPSRFLAADVRKLAPKDIKPAISHVRREDLLLAACAPCQPFTKLGTKTRGSEATLLGQFARFVEELKPGQIFVENVPGLTKVPRSSTYNRFRKMLSDLGYGFYEGIIDAKAHGVPQTRRRFIMIGILGLNPPPPPPTHGLGLLPYKAVEDAIRSYPPIKAGESCPIVPNHRASALSSINLKRLQHTPHDGGDRRNWPSDLKLHCHMNGHKGHTDVYGRMWWGRPAPALTCRCDSLSNGRYGHPEQDRAISLREAASLQSFDDSYVFYGPSKNHLAAQIGNAVPVKLAEAIGKHILALTNNEPF